jgi:hypothetical protein
MLVICLIAVSVVVCSATSAAEDKATALCEERLDRAISVVCDSCFKDQQLAPGLLIPKQAIVQLVAQQCCKKMCSYETIKSLCCGQLA